MSHHISRCSVEAFALTLPFSLGHEITVVAPRYYSYKYCKLHIWATFSIVFQHKPDRYLFKGKAIALCIIYGSIFWPLIFRMFFFFFSSLFLKSDEATHPAIKCSSPILALVNFIGYEQAHRDNYKSAYWKAVKGGCSFFSRPTRLGWNRLVNITSYYNNNTRLNNKKNT